MPLRVIQSLRQASEARDLLLVVTQRESSIRRIPAHQQKKNLPTTSFKDTAKAYYMTAPIRIGRGTDKSSGLDRTKAICDSKAKMFLRVFSHQKLKRASNCNWRAP
jgi:hypothetical protein